jgi:hypothetical protein
LVIATAALTSQGLVFANVGKQVSAQATLAGALNFVVEVRELRLDDIVYVIPAEGWTYKITSETRLFNISSETRIYKISEETSLRTIDSETRIHII